MTSLQQDTRRHIEMAAKDLGIELDPDVWSVVDADPRSGGPGETICQMEKFPRLYFSFPVPLNSDEAWEEMQRARNNGIELIKKNLGIVVPPK